MDISLLLRRFSRSQRQVWQSLKRKLGFVSTVVLTMGLTLGALLTVLSLSYQLIYAPLPYPNADRLYQLNSEIFDGDQNLLAQGFTYPAAIEVHRQQYQSDSIVEHASLLHFSEDVLTSHAAQPTLHIGYTTKHWFESLKPKMALGDALGQAHNLDAHIPVAVISYQSWQDYFAGSTDVLEQSVSFSGVNFRIIGVLGKDFIDPKLNEIGVDTQVWLPWDYNTSGWLRGNWSMLAPKITMVVKLKDTNRSVDVIEQQLSGALDSVWQNNNTVEGPLNGSNVKLNIVPLAQVISGDIGTTLALLLIGVVGLVAIATVNIANLMMSRTAEQQRVLAIRAAVGASPNQIFASLLAETSQLMFMAIALALPVSALGFGLINSYLSGYFPRADELGLTGFTFACALLIAIAFALIFAFLSSRMINYVALNQTLQSSGKGTGIQVSAKVTMVLIFSQVAIACGLIFVNGLLFNDALKQINTPMGFNADNVYRLNLSFSGQAWPDEPALIATMSELERAIEQLPQVQASSRSSSPLRRFYPDQRSDLDNQKVVNYEAKRVSHDYFDILEQQVIAGEVFSAQDRLSHQPMVVINDVLARQLVGPNASYDAAIGKRLVAQGNDIVSVVAVVEGITKPGERQVPPRAYSPVSMGVGSALIKFKPNQTISREQMVSVLSKVDPMFSVGRFDSLADLRDRALFTQYVSVVTTVTLAILSLFIAAVGLYGILSYATQMRRVEIGTRMAIGASRPALIKMMVFDQLKPVVAGIVFATLVLLGIYIQQSSHLQLYWQLSSGVIYIETIVAIVVITISACYLPLRRYINRPVMYALRQQ